MTEAELALLYGGLLLNKIHCAKSCEHVFELQIFRTGNLLDYDIGKVLADDRRYLEQRFLVLAQAIDALADDRFHRSGKACPTDRKPRRIVARCSLNNAVFGQRSDQLLGKERIAATSL